MNPPSTSKPKRKLKSVNPELEAINETYKEIHRPRSSSPKRASKGRKLFTHQNEHDDPVENVSMNAEASTSTSTSTSKDNEQDDVFKKPSVPPPKRFRTSLQLSSTSSANQSSNSTITSRADHEQSATNSTHSESRERPTEEDVADQMNVDEPMEFETVQTRQLRKRPERKTKTITKTRAKSSNANPRGAISLSNIIEDGNNSFISRVFP